MSRFGSALGGRPVGYLDDLSPVERAAIRELRQWSDTTRARAADGQDETPNPSCLGRICELCVIHGRRTLIRHGTGCGQLGADEACFAAMVRAASEGEQEDATLFAALLVRPDMAPYLAALATQFGLGLRRGDGSRSPETQPPGRPAQRPGLLH